MKKVLLVFALLCAQAFGQTTGACRNSTAINKYGQPTGGAQVTVYAYSGGSLGIYADSALTRPRPNPFAADADGNYVWCAIAGSHAMEQVTYGNSVKTFDVTLPGGAGSGGSGTPYLNTILGATGTNIASNGNYAQTWQWNLTSTIAGMTFTENSPSTGSGSMLFHAHTLTGSTAEPLCATAGSAFAGFCVSAAGNIVAQNGASFNGPVGIVTPNPVNWPTSPMGINVASYSGSDIGAQANTAISANSCGASTPCQLVIPPGLYSFSTAITLPQNTSLDCGMTSGWSNVQVGGATSTSLTYTGSGDAITLSGPQATLTNCSLTVGSTATSGVKMTAGQTLFSHGYLIGGGPSTKLVNINCGIGCEKPEVDFVDFYGYTGRALYCANSNDTMVTNLTGYATGGQSTSVAVTIDSQCNGFKATRISFGGSGLHGIVFSDSLGTGGPTWTVLNLAEADCPQGGAAILFDSTLANEDTHARITNSWGSGAGLNCSSLSNPTVTISPGIEIDGGMGITLDTVEARSSAGDGILINGTGVYDVTIVNSQIWGNNFKYRTFGGDNGDFGGIRVNAIGSGLVITGNYLGNFPGALDGHQHYGVKMTATNPLNTVVSNNNFNDNTVIPYTFVKGYAYPEVYGNAVINSSSTPFQTMLGDFAVTTLTGAATVTPHLIPNFGSVGSYKMGLGMNGYFDGTNWHFNSDNVNNGGSLIVGDENGAGTIYAVPTSGSPTVDQTLTMTTLNANNQALAWNPSGAVTIPKFASLTSSSANPATVCTICFAKTDVLSWRNNVNSGNLNLGIDSSDRLAFNSTPVAPLVSPAFTGTITLPVTGSTQCLHVNTSGVLSGTGSDCGTGSGMSNPMTAPGDLIVGIGFGGTNRVAVTSNVSITSTSLVTITGLSWTFPASANANSHSFACHLSYSQATAAATNAFGVQATTTTPTNLYARMHVDTSLANAGVNATLPTLASTTATNIGTFTPGAFGSVGTVADIFTADIHGTLEQGAGATTLNIMALTGSGSDTLTIYRGSYCELEP